MNVTRKLEIAKQAVENIARHDDESVEIRDAALQHIVALIVHETIALKARNTSKIAAQVAALTPPERA